MVHSLMATVAAVGVGGVEFFMFYLFFLGTVLSLYVFFLSRRRSDNNN